MNNTYQPVPFMKYAKLLVMSVAQETAAGLIVEILDDAVLEHHDHAFVRTHIFDCWNRAEKIMVDRFETYEFEFPMELKDFAVKHFRETLQQYLNSLDKHISRTQSEL